MIYLQKINYEVLFYVVHEYCTIHKYCNVHLPLFYILGSRIEPANVWCKMAVGTVSALSSVYIGTIDIRSHEMYVFNFCSQQCILYIMLP